MQPDADPGRGEKGAARHRQLRSLAELGSRQGQPAVEIHHLSTLHHRGRLNDLGGHAGAGPSQGASAGQMVSRLLRAALSGTAALGVPTAHSSSGVAGFRPCWIRTM